MQYVTARELELAAFSPPFNATCQRNEMSITLHSCSLVGSYEHSVLAFTRRFSCIQLSHEWWHCAWESAFVNFLKLSNHTWFHLCF